MITNSKITDLDAIFNLYEIASNYQKAKKTVVVWPKFETELVVYEINESRQYKLIIDNEIACVWAITFKDEQIWEGKKKDKAIYIHRIATNPKFRGQHFVKQIVKWARDYSIKNNIDYIRLDTLGENAKLIKYYKSAGFNFLGMFKLTNTSELPDHYAIGNAALFEIDLRNNEYLI